MSLLATAPADLDALLDDGPRCTAGGIHMRRNQVDPANDPPCGFPAAWVGTKPCGHRGFICPGHFERRPAVGVCRTCEAPFEDGATTWTAL